MLDWMNEAPGRLLIDERANESTAATYPIA
jgi:hypothetical protein